MSEKTGSQIRPETLTPFFEPQSVAIIGASSDPTKIGGRPISNLKIGKFAGPIYPINPNYPEIQGLKAYKSLTDIGQPVDLAIIVVPMLAVVAAVQACADYGVKAAIIISSGFAEIDEKGAEEQKKIEAIVARSGMRVIGPNCMGTINSHNGLIATFATGINEQGVRTGGISVASQSGAFGAFCFTVARERGYGINLWATMGNQCDVEFSDCLAYMAQDPNTDVVMGYIEGIRDAGRFINALKIAQASKKPVVIMKVGTSDVGSAAAASHTASLTGSDAVFNALLKQYDVYRAYSLDEMFDVAYACTAKKLPKDDRLGVITVSGGVGVIISDAAAVAGMDMPPLPDETQAKLRELVPFAGTRNPLDVTAQLVNQPSLMEPMFDALLGEGGYPSALAFIAGIGLVPARMKVMLPIFERIAQKYPDRVIAMAILALPEFRQALEKMGYLCFEDPSRAVNAMAALARFGKAFARGPGTDVIPSVPAGATPIERGKDYTEFDGKKMLISAGVPAVDERIVTAAADAAKAASEIGFPVVLKIVSPDIQHKSEVGGVMLNVADADAAKAGFESLMSKVGAKVPTARLDGVLVAPMIKGGVETILGVNRDPVFGPVVMFGLGGIFVEVFKDVTFRLAPFGIKEARAMLQEVKGYAMLKGVRGAPPADEEAVAQALVNLSVYAAANADTLESIDVNPFLVLPQGKGGLAVDALIVPRND